MDIVPINCAHKIKSIEMRAERKTCVCPYLILTLTCSLSLLFARAAKRGTVPGGWAILRQSASPPSMFHPTKLDANTFTTAKQRTAPHPGDDASATPVPTLSARRLGEPPTLSLSCLIHGRCRHLSGPSLGTFLGA